MNDFKKLRIYLEENMFLLFLTLFMLKSLILV